MEVWGGGIRERLCGVMGELLFLLRGGGSEMGILW